MLAVQELLWSLTAPRWERRVRGSSFCRCGNWGLKKELAHPRGQRSFHHKIPIIFTGHKINELVSWGKSPTALLHLTSRNQCNQLLVPPHASPGGPVLNPTWSMNVCEEFTSFSRRFKKEEMVYQERRLLPVTKCLERTARYFSKPSHLNFLCFKPKKICILAIRPKWQNQLSRVWFAWMTGIGKMF